MSAPEMTSGFWFSEEITDHWEMRMKLNSITYNKQSPFQLVQVIETETFGACPCATFVTSRANLRDE